MSNLASFMAMPEASVDEDCNLPLPEPHVRSAWHLFGANGIAVAPRKKPLSEENFRGGVVGMDGGHYTAALGRRNCIGHEGPIAETAFLIDTPNLILEIDPISCTCY